METLMSLILICAVVLAIAYPFAAIVVVKMITTKNMAKALKILTMLSAACAILFVAIAVWQGLEDKIFLAVLLGIGAAIWFVVSVFHYKSHRSWKIYEERKEEL